MTRRAVCISTMRYAWEERVITRLAVRLNCCISRMSGLNNIECDLVFDDHRRLQGVQAWLGQWLEGRWLRDVFGRPTRRKVANPDAAKSAAKSARKARTEVCKAQENNNSEHHIITPEHNHEAQVE